MSNFEPSAFSLLASSPFAHPARFFTTPELTQRLSLIRHLLQNSEQLLFVLAESGCGKTSLLQQLLNGAPENWWVYALSCTPALSPEAMLAQLLTQFNVKHEGKSVVELQTILRRHLANTLLNHQLPILLVDDAHLLPLASLKVLVELALLGEPQSRLRIALFCEPQITSILAAPEFQLVQKTLIHTLDIPPLSQTQVREYLHFHLEGTSLANHHPFDMETLRVLYQESEGVFGKINQLAQQRINHFLQQQVGEQLPQPSIKRSLLLLGMASLLAGSALLAYTYSPEMFAPQNPAPKKPEPIIPVPPPEVKAVKTAGVEKLPPKPVEKPAVPEKPVEKVEANPLAVLLGKPELKSSEWLLAQSPQAYTIQVMGLHDLQAFKKLLGTENSANMIVFKTEYQKKEWYVLLFGIYPTQEQATAALNTLPENFRMSGTQPWVRNVAGVQQSLLKPR